MFNRTVYKTETIVTPVTRVVEKSITPDRVSEMYDKVRSEVELNLIQIIKIESNTLRGVVVEFTNSYDTATKTVLTKFLLNGEEHVDRRTMTIEEVLTQENAFDVLAEHYKKVVGGQLCSENAKITFSGLRKYK